MKRFAGQAGKTIGYVIHHTGMILMTIFLLMALGLGGFAYRLSLGPVQIPWITSRLANMASGQGVAIHIEHAALGWSGYKRGGAAPLYLQLGDITATSATGIELAAIPTARLVFLPTALLGTEAPVDVTSADALFNGSNVPVSLNAAIRFGGFLKLSSAVLNFTLGPGQLGAGGTSLPITGGAFSLNIRPKYAELDHGVLRLQPVGQSTPTVSLAGNAQLTDRWRGRISVDVDRVRADDLAAYWPPQLIPKTRNWVTHNITAGEARAAAFTIGLSAPGNLSTLGIDATTGHFTGVDLDVGWIPHAQPITHVSGDFTLTDRDDILITANTANLGGVTGNGGTFRIAGVSQRDQTATLDIPITGTVTAVTAVLNAAPLNLMKTAPGILLAATGGVTGTVKAGFPLLGNLKIDQVNLDVQAALQDVTMPAPIPKLDFTNGDIMLKASTKGLSATGTAELAGQAATMSATARFTVPQPAITFDLKTKIGNKMLHQFGLDATPDDADGIAGTIPIAAHFEQTVQGDGLASLDADLGQATIAVPAFGWSKKSGIPGHATLKAGLKGQMITTLGSVDAVAPGLAIDGATDPEAPRRLVLTQLRIGASEAQGSITAPARPSDPWQVDLTGPSLDITAILNPPPPTHPEKPTPSPVVNATPTGPLWTASLRFETLILAAGNVPHLHALLLSGNGQGSTIRAATGIATSDTGQPINVTVAPAARTQTIHLDTTDGGLLLRALGAFNDLDGGALALDATDSETGAIAGTLTITKFRLLQAPGFAKLLQGLTIYGVPDATSGPGLAFEHLVAPFAIDAGQLSLKNARAYSSSLGFTASGRIDLVTGDTNLDTTIVPAYALNTLPGKIPVLGKLFSAEKGGGLFAVRAKITGKLTRPQVSVNPFSALTPGVLRDVFGIGGTALAPPNGTSATK